MNRILQDDFFVLGESNFNQDKIEKARQIWPNIALHGTVIKGGVIWHEKKISVFFMEGLSDSFRIYTAKNIPENSYFFFTNPSTPYSIKTLKEQIDFFHFSTENRFSNKQIIHLANDKISLEAALSCGLTKSIFCNQNTWLDFNKFKIIRSFAKKRFSMAINCRPELIKRPYLAELIKNLLVIQGINYNKENAFDLNSLNPKYINKTRVSPEEVNDLLNQAYTGGIFSEREGACFASSEYLLTGLPVISTPSIGGRDYWYNERNSIICNPTKESVLECHEIALDRLKKYNFIPEEIRTEHIAKQISLRERFIVSFQEILDESYSNACAKTIIKAYCNSGLPFKKIRYPLY